MAVDLKGKKTSLEEEASIYQKREDDMSGKERFQNMSPKEKRQQFKTYYLPTLLVILAVAAVAFYIIWVDFINKADIYLHCAILNESIEDGDLTELSDQFTTYLGMDPEKEETSFYIYYTDTDVATDMGTDAGTDLTEIGSRLVASALDCMIAKEEDVVDTYMENGFMMDLSEILTEDELTALEPYLYERDGIIYGVNLKDCDKYQALFEDRSAFVEEPILFVITNAEDEGKQYAKALIEYLFDL